MLPLEGVYWSAQLGPRHLNAVVLLLTSKGFTLQHMPWSLLLLLTSCCAFEQVQPICIKPEARVVMQG
jgi:hypothetical protein